MSHIRIAGVDLSNGVDYIGPIYDHDPKVLFDQIIHAWVESGEATSEDHAAMLLDIMMGVLTSGDGTRGTYAD